MEGKREEIDTRVRAKAGQGEFLGQLLAFSRGQSADVHEDFIRRLSALAAALRQIFDREGLVECFPSPAADFWASSSGRHVAFVDGGVARIDLPSAAPMGIRVGTYAVRIGDTSELRESFSTEPALVDELYSADGWTFDDAFDDTQKLTDAARIIGEASGALKQLRRHADLSAMFLHGPLINPVAPYGTPGFPAFSQDAATLLLDDRSRSLSEDERHFVVLYRLILEEFTRIKKPVVGVVERSISKHPAMIHAHLDAMQQRRTLSPDDAQRIRDELSAYRLNDAAVLSVMLAPGEYCSPVPVNRQLPKNKWPQQWYAHIEAYPSALTTYVKSSEHSDPFRVEMHEELGVSVWALELVYHMAKLLPTYGFPVGLDIADKYAKVPNWMSQGVRKEHAVALLKSALRSGDPKTLEFAKKVLTARGRDWLFRPKA